MNVSNLEQKLKQARLKQFLHRLSHDPSLYSHDDPEDPRPLAEIFSFAEYRPRSERVDLGELVSRVLKKLGVEAGSDDMIDFIMDGGTVGDFLLQPEIREMNNN
mgnify:FL=1